MRANVCLNLGQVFVLWIRSSVGICFRGEWEEGGVPHIHIHGLRHTFGSQMAMAAEAGFAR